MLQLLANTEKLGTQEFYVPMTTNPDGFLQVLLSLRVGHGRSWERFTWKLVSIGQTPSIPEMEMKYVVVTAPELGTQLFVFPKVFDHDLFYEALSAITHISPKEKYIYVEKVSAGFTDGLSCYGRSETLGISSNASDIQLIRNGGSKQ